MRFKLLTEVLKYFDCFGTNFNFYYERNRKFYTPFGGVLTILSIIFGIIVFICINLDDFLHNIPNSTTSTAKGKNREIKFGEEKIWLPWRIRDYDGKSINHSELLYPIIYYYKGNRNNTKYGMNLTYNIINYRLCNETSMINNTNSYIIDIDLDQLYCINMEELNMGGNFDSNFINYVEFDLYFCKNGIDYDNNNNNCTSTEKVFDAVKKYNSLTFELYYPVVNYQPMNKTTPIYVSYSNYFYHLSRFSNKIDRIYLQQHILIDDRGWIIKKENSYSYWGYLSLKGDSYATGSKRDLINEGSTSRLYSFNIYIKSDVVYYNRSYKKIFLIIADGLPIVNVIFTIFKLIAKVFKISSGNQKLTELLFENLQEKKKPRINNEKFNVLKLKGKKFNSEKKVTTKKNDNNTLKIDKSNNNNNITNINTNDLTSIQLTKTEQSRNIGFQSVISRKNSFASRNVKSKFFKNSNHINNSQKKLQVNNFSMKCSNAEINNNNINISIHNNLGDFSNNLNDVSSSIPFNKMYIKKKLSAEEKKNINNNILKPKPKTNYILKKLFPYKFYLCSIFIKNIDLSKKPIFFTKKFVVVYNFICQLFDISSYLILQKEFQIMKNTMMMGKFKDIFENRQKINVNDHSFNTDMKECLDTQKFSILGRVNHYKI